MECFARIILLFRKFNKAEDAQDTLLKMGAFLDGKSP